MVEVDSTVAAEPISAAADFVVVAAARTSEALALAVPISEEHALAALISEGPALVVPISEGHTLAAARGLAPDPEARGLRRGQVSAANARWRAAAAARAGSPMPAGPPTLARIGMRA